MHRDKNIAYILLAYSDLPDNRRRNCNIAKYKLNDKQLCICAIQRYTECTRRNYRTKSVAIDYRVTRNMSSAEALFLLYFF